MKILSQIISKFINELEKNDPNDIFAQPVTDQIAPGYSTMIRNPMDFSTIKTKTENLVYEVTNQISERKFLSDQSESRSSRSLIG